MSDIENDLQQLKRMEKGVLIFRRAIAILKDLGGFSDEEVTAAISTAKTEISDEFPTESEACSE